MPMEGRELEIREQPFGVQVDIEGGLRIMDQEQSQFVSGIKYNL